jgi:branched-chain amino acid transport system ATP-binding protein
MTLDEPTAPVLALDKVDAGYGGVPVLRGVSLAVGLGEIVALLGPNGAGKSTTAKVCAGLLRPTGGRVLVDGTALGRRQSPHRIAHRGIRFVTESRGVFASLSVRDNLRLGARGDHAAAHAALNGFPALQPLLSRRAGLLSGGEQQMLAIARALAGRPRIVIVDELSLGLAPIVVDNLLESITNLARSEGLGLVLIEQHVDKVTRIADRVVHLSRGRIDD